MNNKRELIVMVDDDAAILRAGKNALSERYSVATFSGAEKLFEFLKTNTPALVLLDVMMPGIDGYEAIKRLKADENTRKIPVIFLTGKTDTENELEGLELGAIDYISKPFVPALLLKRIEVHLLVQTQKQRLEHQSIQLQNFNANLQRMVEEKTKTVIILQNAIIKTVAELVEYWDDITGGHVDRTMKGVSIIIDALKKHGAYDAGMDGLDIDLVLQSSQMHDVGKIVVNDYILRKPGPLNRDEYEEMKKHTLYGVQVIDKIKAAAPDNDFLNYAEIFAATHHERWDGSGYPNGLCGEQIPLLGRIMAFADVYDALVSERPYKKPFTHERAVSIIKNGRGTQFDPGITDIFLDVSERFKAA